jgi:arylesterase/paraoxonase
MLRLLLILVVLLAVLAAGIVVWSLWQLGQFERIEPHFAGRCQRVAGAVGPEDLTIHPRTGVVYVSAYDRRAAFAGQPVPGGIYAYELADPVGQLVNLTPDADVTLQPHGLSLWVGAAGRAVLFVINHPPPGTGLPAHTVEVFELEGDVLRHRESLSDPELLVMPNDIVAVGANRFYLTNTHRNPPGRAQTLETLLRRPGANVVHYDGARFRVAVPDLVYPNGINASRDGRTLYVATTTPRRLLVYARDPETETLSLREEVFAGSGLDNVEVDADGDLWIGAHPKMLAVAAHRDDPSQPSPSQVLRVSPRPDGGYAVDEIYLSAGDELAAASVAARRGQRLVIGQIFGDGILDCVMD